MTDLFSDALSQTTEQATETILKPSDPRYHALGQFFTPKPVAELMAKIAQTIYKNADKDHLIRVLDPAAGQGALLAPLSPLPEFFTYGVEIDPQNRKELSKASNVSFTADGVNLLVQLYTTAVLEGSHGAPFELYLMNPPYNLQITIPDEASEFISVKRDYKTGRLVALSHEFFLEAAVRIIHEIEIKSYYSADPYMVLSLHSENHLAFVKKLAEVITNAPTTALNFWIYHIGKAYPELPYNFFLLLVFHNSSYGRTFKEFNDEKEFLYNIANKARVSLFDLKANKEDETDEPLTEHAKQIIKNIISTDSLEVDLKPSDIIPQVGVKRRDVVIKNPLLLEGLSVYMGLQHPLTDEEISITEAFQTSLIPELLQNPIIKPFLAVRPEEFPSPAELTSLSPITPLQYLAFTSPGYYTAQKDLKNENGEIVIKKGETYYIKNIIRKREREKRYTEKTTNEDGKEVEKEVTKKLTYHSKVLQIIKGDKVIMEVEI